MKLINFMIAISSWTLGADFQSIDPGQIYFMRDSGSEIHSSLASRFEDNLQKNTVNQNRGKQDSYLQVQTITPNLNFGQHSTENKNHVDNGKQSLPQLNTNLHPPQPNANADVQYYVNIFSNNYDAVNKRVDIGGTLNAEVKNVSLAMSEFALNLLRNVPQTRDNFVISPFSIGTLLALLQQGSLGETQMQLSEALLLRPQESSEALKTITQNIKSRSSRNILRVASNVYVADAFELNPSFQRVASNDFGSEITPITFSQPQEAVRNINRWVASKTNNKIQELLSNDAVGETTQLVLVNAVYFKGIWETRFRPESTLTGGFNKGNGAMVQAQFMRARRVFKYGMDPRNKAQVAIIPFEDNLYSLVVVLPSEKSSLSALVETLTGSQLAEYQKFTAKDIALEIPKFIVRSDSDLNPVLRKMGITNIFNQAKSELSGIGVHRNYSPQVSSAVHTAMLSIDEDGGSAAAASAFAVVALSYDDSAISFKANRPFLAILWDTQSALPLFIAKIEDPTV